MAMEFEYDEEGGTFFYFLLSFWGLVIIPATYYLWPRKKTDGMKHYFLLLLLYYDSLSAVISLLFFIAKYEMAFKFHVSIWFQALQCICVACRVCLNCWSCMVVQTDKMGLQLLVKKRLLWYLRCTCQFIFNLMIGCDHMNLVYWLNKPV